MPLTTKQAIFSLVFLLSWLLLLLLGESYLGYILLGGMSLLFLLFASEIEWQKISQYKWLVVVWLLFLFSIGLSLFFSTNLPISIHLTARYAFIFLTFWFFLLVKKSLISSQRVIKSLLLIGLVVILVSTIFQFFPHLAGLLPGMNLLHATYGHNHLAALLLLLIPLSWWLASEYAKAGQSFWWWFLPMAFTLGLLTSFGRVAVVIGLIQFLFIFRLLQKNNLVKKYRLNFILKTLLGLFLIVLIGKVFFSVATIVKPNFVCPVPSLEKQLCKSVKVESRPKYWQWAVEIVKDKPWLGSGPGTFGMASKKHHLIPYGSTNYAHNAFLQALAEMGLIGGGLFAILMFGLLYLAWRSLEKKSQWSWRQATFLGISAIYLDVLFDFDWDFVGIFGITVILLALLIRDRIDKSAKITKKSLSNFFKTGYFILIFALISLAGLYLYTDYLTRSDQVQQAFQFFPYFHWHRKIYETDLSLDDQNKQKLFKIYAAQPDIYFTKLSQAKDEKQRQQIKEQWFEIDPWSVVNQDLISYYLAQQEWAQAEKWIEQVYQLWTQAKDSVSYEQKIKLSGQMLELADGLYKESQVDQLVKLEKYEVAMSVLKTMIVLQPDDYWLAVQPANFAVLQGDLESAKQLYQQCLDNFQSDSQPDFRHDDCYYGLQSIKVGYPDPDRYSQVSKIIRGEAVWQDFAD